MKGKFITSLLLGGAMVTIMTMDSCAKANTSDVNQDKIYTTYEVFYNANSDKTWVTANFRLAGPTGTNLELDSTSYVLFNGDTLPYNWLFQSHFKEYAGRITTGTFVYENLDGDVFTNALPLVDTATFQAGFDTIKKSIANTITWNGTPLNPNEYVGIFVGSWVWGQDALAVQDGDGATNIVLGTGQLSPLALGNATVYMDRAKLVNATQAPPLGGGGTIKATYRPINATVQVIN
jgi:hypothetical protein